MKDYSYLRKYGANFVKRANAIENGALNTGLYAKHKDSLQKFIDEFELTPFKDEIIVFFCECIAFWYNFLMQYQSKNYSHIAGSNTSRKKKDNGNSFTIQSLNDDIEQLEGFDIESLVIDRINGSVGTKETFDMGTIKFTSYYGEKEITLSSRTLMSNISELVRKHLVDLMADYKNM